MSKPRQTNGMVALVLLTTAGWLGCGGGGSGTGPSATASLSGVVRVAGSDAPVQGAGVAVGIGRASTDQDGRYELQNVPTGPSVTVVVTAAGFDQYDASIAIEAGSNSHDFSLVRKTLLEIGDFVAYLPPEISTYRGVYFLVPGFGGDLRPLVRGEGDPFDQEYRRRALELGRKFDLALLGSNSLPLTLDSYSRMSAALTTLAAQSGHPELRSAPILLDGVSLGACVSYEFSRLHGQRVIGLLAQKPCAGGLPDGAKARDVPAYFLLGELDTPERITHSTHVFEVNRAAGAPWAIVLEPGIGHERTGALSAVFNWLDAVLTLRLPDAPGALRPVDQASGWLGDRVAFSIAEHPCYEGVELEASWLPSELTADEWQAVASNGTATTVMPCETTP